MLFLALVMVAICSGCFAEEVPPEITAALDSAGIREPVQFQYWGDTAACFAETDGTKRLIVMEKKDGLWGIMINNPTALLQDMDFPKLWLDSDNAVYWTYALSDQVIVRYHSTKNADGTWDPVDQEYSDSGFGGDTYTLNTIWDAANGGEIIREFGIYDDNENLQDGPVVQALPASWLRGCIRLDRFDVSRFPTMFSDEFANENGQFFQEAAAAMMPEYTFVKGMLKNDALHFLMEKKNGDRVYVIC
ncbi:MAG: hypothetical protein IJ174_08130, partial [Clostridia bacterium]|nr:hypothetical protein [Clostridia bacterium]